MMDAHTLILYVVAVSLVMVVPGPSMLLALNNGASHGPRVVACGMAGAAISDILIIAAVGCGLGALLQASEQLFALLKWGGAAYLLYLAWGLWHAPVQALTVATASPSAGSKAAFLRALLVGLSNPKGILFYSAFLPQFIRPEGHLALQYATLALLSAAIDCVIMTVYAVGGRHAVRTFSARAARWINRSCAGTLAFLAVGVSMYRRSEVD